MRVAIDTNVLVRLVTNDDAAQARAARDHLEGQQIYLAKSVLLEAEWVLRYSYGLDRQTITAVFRQLLGLEGSLTEAYADVVTAVEWYERGLDFADALHLASSRSCDRLVTFDRRFASSSEALGATPEVALLP